MSVHQWATEELQILLQRAGAEGYDDLMALRALLSAVVERSKSCRGIEDLAQELEFLAANLDDGRDYSFMRP